MFSLANLKFKKKFAVLTAVALVGFCAFGALSFSTLQTVKINGVSATELATPLGTLLSYESSGVRYLLLGSVTPSAIEAVAKGL